MFLSSARAKRMTMKVGAVRGLGELENLKFVKFKISKNFLTHKEPLKSKSDQLLSHVTSAPHTPSIPKCSRLISNGKISLSHFILPIWWISLVAGRCENTLWFARERTEKENFFLVNFSSATMWKLEGKSSIYSSALFAQHFIRLISQLLPLE